MNKRIPDLGNGHALHCMKCGTVYDDRDEHDNCPGRMGHQYDEIRRLEKRIDNLKERIEKLEQ